MDYDVAIIGTGPAGIAAALTLGLHNKTIAWFGPAELSAKVGKSEKIANYPGVPMVSGEDLNAAFRAQIEEAGLEIIDKQVQTIMPMGSTLMVQAGMDVYNAKTVLLATGAVSGKGFPGEESLLGSGVSYCATCDGFLYKGKTIAVYCGAPRFEHEAVYLAEMADHVYLYTPYAIGAGNGGDGSTGAFPENVTVNDGKMKEIRAGEPAEGVFGGPRVNGIGLTDGRTVDVDGVFVLRDAVAPASLVKGLEVDGAHIVVNRNMETNIKGVYAAGDCTGRPYQITKGVGEGNIAAHSILEYLRELDQ